MSNAPKPPKSQRYATAGNPTIAAVLHEMYRFSSEAEARHTLDIIARNFIPSRQQIRNEAHPSVHLWIKGYGVSEQDRAQGVIGHFALITYKETNGRWSLFATKIDTPARQHPQRAQVKRDNPNWGHPVLRAIRKGKSYPSLEKAQSELALLHEQFPRVSIPNPGKLYIMIYCSDKPAKQRMVKHTLEIVVREDGTHGIDCKENTPRAKKPQKELPRPQKTETAEPQGYFTAKVALNRVRKGKKPPITPREPSEDKPT